MDMIASPIVMKIHPMVIGIGDTCTAGQSEGTKIYAEALNRKKTSISRSVEIGVNRPFR